MKTKLILTPLMILLCIGTTLAQNETVGTLNGNLSVSPGGAAVYSIGIDLPPGRGGLTPQLALQYNSQGETGVLGKGWGISGWSFVERVGSTMYHDGKIGTVDFVNDQFSYNGNRLFNVHQTDKLYRTEVDNVSRIVFVGSKNDKNTHWEMQTTDGLNRQYGGSKQSRQNSGDAGSASVPIRWHLNKIWDDHNNSILYDYLQDQSTGSGNYLATPSVTKLYPSKV
jgi:hypothetical protein